MPRAIVLTLALASAFIGASADPPLRLPELVIERGEWLPYVYPPYDELSLASADVIRVTEQGDGKVVLVGLRSGVVEVAIVISHQGRNTAYVGRVEVVDPLDEVIGAQARLAFEGATTTAVEARAAVLLRAARSAHEVSGRRPAGLYEAFVYACRARALLESRGLETEGLVAAKDLMSTTKAALDAQVADAVSALQPSIGIRNWSGLAAGIEAVLRIVPDPRDVRHRRARLLWDFYAPFLPPVRAAWPEGGAAWLEGVEVEDVAALEREPGPDPAMVVTARQRNAADAERYRACFAIRAVRIGANFTTSGLYPELQLTFENTDAPPTITVVFDAWSKNGKRFSSRRTFCRPDANQRHTLVTAYKKDWVIEHGRLVAGRVAICAGAFPDAVEMVAAECDADWAPARWWESVESAGTMGFYRAGKHPFESNTLRRWMPK